MSKHDTILPPGLDPGEVLAAIRRQVSTSGWFPIHAPAENGRPQHSYSVGMSISIGQPDVLIMGVPAELAEGMMFMIYEGLRSGHLQLPDTEGLLHGVLEQPVLARPVAPRGAEKICLAHKAIYPKAVPSLVHFVVPDPGARFPHDPGCDNAFRTAQDIARLA